MSLQKNISRNRGLGRGIEALIPGVRATTQTQKGITTEQNHFFCEVDRLVPNEFQPRDIFDSKALGDLARSIKENGVIQPLIVRKQGSSFQIIAGERRWKAAMLAGLKKVPVIIKEVTNRQALEMAIIENIQRDDLSPIEEAKAYKQLMTEFMLTQEQVAIKVGKDRTTVANTIRLLLLPETIQNDLLNKRLSMGHARALLALPTEKKQLELKDRILSENLNVRQTEKLIQKIKNISHEETGSRKNEDFTYLVNELKRTLQTKVQVSGKRNKGKIIVHYSSEEELDRIFNIFVN